MIFDWGTTILFQMQPFPRHYKAGKAFIPCLEAGLNKWTPNYLLFYRLKQWLKTVITDCDNINQNLFNFKDHTNKMITLIYVNKDVSSTVHSVFNIHVKSKYIIGLTDAAIMECHC